MIPRGLLVVLTAPSGTGKSSLVRALLGRERELAFSVSHTTRAARAGEREGIDYRFVDRPTFERMRDAGAFAEWAEVHGSLYGTAHEEIRAALLGAGEVLLDIDVQGARQVADRFPEAVTVFALPPDAPTLEARLRGRGTESEESIRRRLAAAAAEVGEHGRFRYLIVNDAIEDAVADLRAILRAERLRASRRKERAEAIVATFEGRRP